MKFNYAKSGDDWPDVQCKFGKEQSPINVVLGGELCLEPSHRQDCLSLLCSLGEY